MQMKNDFDEDKEIVFIHMKIVLMQMKRIKVN